MQVLRTIHIRIQLSNLGINRKLNVHSEVRDDDVGVLVFCTVKDVFGSVGEKEVEEIRRMARSKKGQDIL